MPYRVPHLPAGGAVIIMLGRPVADGSGFSQRSADAQGGDRGVALQTILLPAPCLGVVTPFGSAGAGGRDMLLAASRRTSSTLQPSGRRRRRAQHHADGDQLGIGHPHAAADRQPVATHFFGEAQPIPLPFDKMVQVFDRAGQC